VAGDERKGQKGLDVQKQKKSFPKAIKGERESGPKQQCDYIFAVVEDERDVRKPVEEETTKMMQT